MIAAGLAPSLAVVTSLSASAVDPSGTILTVVGPTASTGLPAGLVAAAVLGPLLALLLAAAAGQRLLARRRRAGKVVDARPDGKANEDEAATADDAVSLSERDAAGQTAAVVEVRILVLARLDVVFC